MVAQYVVYATAMAGVLVAAVAGFATAEKIAGPAMLFYDIVAVVFGVRACRQPGLDRATRRAGRMLAATFGATLGITVTFMVTGTKGFPQLGDALHLLAMGLLFVALLLLPLRAATKRERWKMLLDAGTVVLGASMLLWFLAIGPSLDHHRASLALILAAACYPVVDLLVLFGLVRALLRGTGQVTRNTLGMLAFGVVALFVGDAYLGYRQANVAVVERSTFEFVCWLSIHFAFATGAIELWRRAANPLVPAESVRRGVASKLPYVGVGVGYVLLATAALQEHDLFPWVGLVAGGMGITGLVVLRQLLAQSESVEAAETDALTGLANRARLHHELSRDLHRAARTGRTVAVLLIDLNGFKQINDTLGHQAGDGLLVAVADAMRGCVRPDDLVGRLGGDEFAVVLQSVTDEAGAVLVARRITEAIAGPFVVGDVPMSASASIGIALTEAGALPPETLLQRADVAMYDMKRRGSGWQTWQPGLGTAVTAFEADLAAAAGAGQLRLSYRPVHALDGDVVGAETELTWEHPERGTIAAEVFRPIAERIGAAEQIERWLLTEATAAAARWRAEHGAARFVSVIVTPQQLRRPRFTQSVGDALTASGLDPHCLMLELPESTPIREPDAVTRLAGVRELGVRVAVNDFGTAYASLPALAHLPIDTLKLAAGGIPQDAAVAAAAVRLSQALGLATLIGGIEVPADATDLGPLLTGQNGQAVR